MNAIKKNLEYMQKSNLGIKRGAFVCGGIAVLALIFLLTNGIHLFFSTALIEDKVEKVTILGTKKKTYLTLKLLGNRNIYYQIYQDRFQDTNIDQIREGHIISFYTTNNKFSVDKPILASDKFIQFEYFPIFSVNKTKNILHFVSYYLFGGSWINIIFYFSSAATFFYLIPYVVTTSLPRKLFSIAVIGLWLWLFLLG